VRQLARRCCNEIIQRVGAQFVDRRVKGATAVDPGDLFDERELTALDVQGEDVDLDAGLVQRRTRP